MLQITILVFVSIFLASSPIAQCWSFTYPNFPKTVSHDFETRGESYLVSDALQVTRDVTGDPISDLSGRVLYKKRFRLWNKKKDNGVIVASFNTTFTLRITPKTNPPGEGLAFILTGNPNIPTDSHGQWLGIVGPTTNGSSSASVMAVEFDTRKSYPEDMDNNHVGIDVNSVYSLQQVTLNGVELSSHEEVISVVNYNGVNKTIEVFVYYKNESNEGVPIISMPLDLSLYLPEVVYVGFSASTGMNFTQLNCIRAWDFSGDELDDSTSKLRVWLVISLISCAILLISVLSYVWWRFRKSRNLEDNDEDEDGSFWVQEIIADSTLGPKKYNLKELKSATGNFNTKNELGRGGFGIVYKGTLDGELVAVKRMLKNNRHGKKNMIAEVSTIGSVHHKNLVKLRCWCYEKKELVLVYEYMPNGSLDQLLYPNENHQKINGSTMINFLNWERRLSIVCGVALALDYLHNECTRRILHRDVKASNILLDSEMNACLGDFGLARMFKLSEKTHHTTIEIAGTLGYMAPEIFHTGKASSETDVYAFGVLVLEIACGRKPGVESDDGESSDSIVDFVWEFHRKGVIRAALDPKMVEDGDCQVVDMERMLMVGLGCCHPTPYMRPSMRVALQVLMGEVDPPAVPFEKPAFVWPVRAPSLSLTRSFSGGMLSSFGSFAGR